MISPAHLDHPDASATAAAPATATPATALRPHRWRVFSISWLLLALLSLAWSIATPLSASPDEPAHIVKAASVARGQFIGEPSSLGHIVQVPRYVASTHALTCFAFRPDVTPDCATKAPGATSDIVDSTTTAGLYNPVYYLLVGWPSLLFGDDTGIYAMRAVSGILTSLFLAFTVVIAYGWRRNALPLAAVGVTATPMLLFLSGSVNPNAVEASATLAVFAAMLAVVRQPVARLLPERSMMVLAGAAVAVNARGLSPLWVALAVFLPLILGRWPAVRDLLRRPPVLWAASGTALATLFALVWLLRTNSLAAAIDDTDNFQQFPGVGASHLTGFINTLRDTFGYAQGMVGNFGWLDTPAPLTTYFTWSVFAGVLLLAAFSLLRGRPLVLAAGLTAVFLLVPPIIQGAYITGGGLIWQGRYTLSLFAMLVFGLAILIAERLPLPVAAGTPALTRLFFIVWLGWSIAQFLSFATALKRYAVGSEGTWPQTLFRPEWSAPGGNILSLVVFALLIGVTAWFGWRLGRERPDALGASSGLVEQDALAPPDARASTADARSSEADARSS